MGRINSITGTATTVASDDYVVIDGATNGTRKKLANSLVTLTDTQSLTNKNAITAAATTDLTLTAGAGTGASLTLGQGSGAGAYFNNSLRVGGSAPASTLAGYTSSELGYKGHMLFGGSNDNWWTTNAYYSSGWKYGANQLVTAINSNAGDIIFKQASAGAADSAITWTNAMTLYRTGNLLIGGTTDISGSGGLKVFGTTAATNTTSGAFQLDGIGMGGGKIFTSSDVTVGGDLTVSGGNVGIGGAPNAAHGLRVDPTGLTGAAQVGAVVTPTFSSAATSSATGVYTRVITAASAFTTGVANAISVDAPSLGAGSAITTQTGLFLSNQGATGVTNAYGIDIAAQSGASTTNIGLRNLGATVLATPASAVSLSTNSTMTFELTNNTTLSVKVRGSDGTTRTGTITLS